MEIRDLIALNHRPARQVLIQATKTLGFKDLIHIPDNTTSGSFGEWLGFAMRELRKAGYKVTVNWEQIMSI
jgi:hypothetical protein